MQRSERDFPTLVVASKRGKTRRSAVPRNASFSERALQRRKWSVGPECCQSCVITTSLRLTLPQRRCVTSKSAHTDKDNVTASHPPRTYCMTAAKKAKKLKMRFRRIDKVRSACSDIHLTVHQISRRKQKEKKEFSERAKRDRSLPPRRTRRSREADESVPFTLCRHVDPTLAWCPRAAPSRDREGMDSQRVCKNQTTICNF